MEQRSKIAVLVLSLCSTLLLLLTSCGGTGASSTVSSPSPTTQPAPGQSAGQQSLVVLVVEENHSYEQVIGNSSMPYLNSLAQQGALATQYYADAHPSIGNYFALTTGAIQTNDNNFSGPLSTDNLVRQMTAAGKTWKVYAEDLPSAGYLGTTVGNYEKHHNPFVYFSDVVNDASQAAKIVPLTQLTTDVSSGVLSDFVFVLPNAIDDGHSCSTGTVCSDSDLLARADQWLKTSVSPLLATSRFQSNGLLLITFDESNIADTRNGGGRVPLIAFGPKAKAGVQSAVLYKHENTLKTVCIVLGVAICPGTAASMSAEDDLVQH
jgi:phosphatidylinositol-3-phosphatase